MLWQSLTMIKLLFCWTDIFTFCHQSLSAEDTSCYLLLIRPRTYNRVFIPGAKKLTSFLPLWIGVFHIAMGRSEVQTMFPKASTCAHIVSVDLMLHLYSTKTDRCVHIKCWLCSACKLPPTFSPTNLQMLKFHSAFPSLLTGKLNEAVENKAFRLNLGAEKGRNQLSTSKWKDSNSPKKLHLSTDLAGSTFLYYFNYYNFLNRLKVIHNSHFCHF